MANWVSRLFGINKAVGDLMPTTFGSFNMLMNNLPVYQADGFGELLGAFKKSDIVYSIVTKKAKAGSRAPFGVYRIKSNKRLREYKENVGKVDLSDLIVLKNEAIEVIENHLLTDKFNNPNPNQSGSEYTEVCLTYLNLTGNVFENVVRKGLDNAGEVLQMYAMPTDRVQIKTDGRYPINPTGYKLLFTLDIDFEDNAVVHSKYANPLWSTDGAHLYGLSPLSAAWNLIEGDNEGWDAVWQMKKNRGAKKIASIQNDKINDYAEGLEMMTALKDEFNKRNADFKDKVMPIWGDVKVSDVGLNAEDLAALQTSQMTFDRLCNVFSVPVEWFNTDKQSKYDNLSQFNKQAIINGVLPDMDKLRDSRNNWARRNKIIKPNEIIDYDVSVFSELEVDKKKMWDWLKDAPFTENEKRVFLGEAALPDEAMNQVLVNRNKISINHVNEAINQRADSGNKGGEGSEGEASQGQ